MTRHDEKQVSTLNHLVSSTLSGCIARLVLHPIDTVKSRLQVQITNPELLNKLKTPLLFEGASSSLQSAEINATYRSTFHAVKMILQYEGLRGFYKGLGASLIFTGPANTLYLTSYEFCKNYLSKNYFAEGKNVALTHLISGFFAESISCIFWVPHDILKERLQIQRSNQVSLSKLIKIIQQDGLLQLYKGYFITLGSFGPFSAIYFLSYEKCKNFFIQQQQHNYNNHYSILHGRDSKSFTEIKEELMEDNNNNPVILPFSTVLFCGGISAGFSSFCTLPLDVIKTRFQVQRRMQQQQSLKMATEENIMYYKNFFDAVYKISKYEGYTAFWKGLTSRVLYAAPNSALIMALCKLITIFLN
ncbi:hypothetical protein ABK040_000197 [Willaertia magna]